MEKENKMISKKTKRAKEPKNNQTENANLKEENIEQSNIFTSHEVYGKRNIIILAAPCETNFSTSLSHLLLCHYLKEKNRPKNILKKINII